MSLQFASAKTYCNEKVTSLTGNKTATVTCAALGGNQYSFTLVSDEAFNSVANKNFYCNPGGVNIGNSLVVGADKKTLSGTFECTGNPQVYAADIFIMYPGTGEARFNFAGAEFIECGPGDEDPPIWDGNPSFTCGSANSFGLNVSSYDADGLVAGYKVKIGSCNVDVKLSKAVKNHSGVISVPLTGCGITLTESSNYTAEIKPYDDSDNVSTVVKSVSGIKKSASTISISSVSCGTVTANSVELIPVTSGGAAALFQVTYNGVTKNFSGTNSFVVDNLEPDTKYTFTVRAVDGCGNLSSTSATTSCTTPYAPHGGADPETVLTETEFNVTSTGNCATSIAGGTSFSKYGDTGAYSHKIEDVDVVGELTLDNKFEEAYSNGYFHESGVTSNKYQYAITSNPKVLNGNYKRITDRKNRLIIAVGSDPSGQTVKLFQFKRKNLAAGNYNVSFTVEDLVTSSLCPQSGLPNLRQLNIIIYKNGTIVYNGFPDIPIGSTFNFTSSGTVAEGDVITLEVRARFLATCTAIAISDLTIKGCLNKAIETTTGSDVFCEDSDVTLVATGTAATSFTWETSSDNVNWSVISGESGKKITVTAKLGNTYYRYKEQGGSTSKVFTLLGQVCCTFLAEQKTIWKETFGQGTGRWQNPNVKNHIFQPYPKKIDDNFYAVVSNSSDANQQLDWPGGKKDHTGDTNGGFLVINVNNSITPPVLIYSQTITPEEGFCLSTYYNLSMFASNIAPAGLPSSFKFEIKDAVTGNILGQGSTGDISDFGMAHWLNYGSSFAPQNSESVIINIYNTGAAGGGNDVVIDDISVSVCNAKIDLYAAYPERDISTVCGRDVHLQAVVDGNLITYFGTDKPYYLWTKSTDGGTSWSIVEIASGYGNQTYTTPAVNGEVALYKIYIAAQESDARKIFNKQPIGGCVINTITNEVKVECVGCEQPSVEISEDVSVCAKETYMPTITATVTDGEVTKYIWKVKGQGESDYTTVATHLSTSLTDSYTVSSIPVTTSVYQVTAVGQDGCENFDEMIMTVVPQPSKPIVSDVFECYNKAGSYTFTATPAEGNTLIWYSASSGGVPLASAPVVQLDTPGTYTYYVSQTDGKCESERVAVTLTVDNEVKEPTVKYKSTCVNGTSVEYSATASIGCSLVWYQNESDTTPLVSKPSVDVSKAGESAVYVSQKNDEGCESKRVKVAVLVNQTVLAVVQQPTEVCGPDKVDLTTAVTYPATGDFKYYKDDKTTEETTPQSVAAGKYYIQLTENGCPSDPQELTATIKNCDDLNLTASIGSTVCEGDEVTVTFTLKNKAGIPAKGVVVNIDEVNLPGTVTVKNVEMSGSTSYSGGVWNVGNSVDAVDTPVEILFTIEAGDSFSLDAYVSAVNGLTFTKVEAIALTDKSYYAKSETAVRQYAVAPIVEDYEECATSSESTFDLSDRVTSGKEHLTWYVDATSSTEVASTTVYKNQVQNNTYYVSNYTATTCESSRTPLEINVKKNAEFVTTPVKTCSADLKRYSVDIEVSAGSVTADYPGVSISNVGNVWTIANIAKGTDVKLSVEDEGCGNIITVTAPACECPVMPAPTTEFPEYTYCNGDAIPEMKAVYGGDPTNIVIRWYDSETSTSSLYEGDTYTASKVGTYYIEAYNTVTECESPRSSVVLKMNLNPVASIEKSNIQFTCDTTTITLKALPESGVSYLWSDAATSQTLQISVAGTYSVEVTDNLTGCSASSSVTVGEDKTTPSVTLTSAEGKTEIDCATPSITIDVTATPAEVSYRWDSGETTPSISATDAGTYSVTVKHKTSGCTASDQMTITKNANLPTVILKADKKQFTCDTLQIELSAELTNITGTARYKWFDDSTNPKVVINSAGTYLLEVTDDLSCKASGSITIEEDKSVPDVSISTNRETLTCLEKDAKLTATDGHTSYVWKYSDGTICQKQPGDLDNELTTDMADTYSVTVKSSTSGCVNSAVRTIGENIDKPSVTASTEEGVTLLTCTRTSLKLKADAVNCTYSWKNSLGTEISTDAFAVVSEADEYTVSVTDVTTGCENSDKIQITADKAKPAVSISAYPSAVITCTDKEITLTVEATDCTFKWGDGSTDDQLVVSSEGTYTVVATSNVNGCTESADAMVTENKTNPTIEVLGTLAVCYPETLDLTDALISQDCETVTYYSDAELQHPVTDTKITTLGDKTYYVQGSNSDGCVSDVAPINVSISELTISIIPDVPVCQGGNIVIWGKGTGVQASKYSMQFTYNETTIGDKVIGDSIGVRVTPGTTSEYILTASNGACVKKLSTKVEVLPLPKTDYVRTGSLSFDVKQVSTGAEPYKYSLDGGAPQDSVNFYVASFGNYKVRTTDVFGCSSEMDVFLEKIVMPIKIPPYFTPNGDGVNDRWEIKNIEYYPDAIIEIYDRYHKLLVRYRGCDAGWDGEYNGHAMPTTDYWYYIRDSELQIISGHFLLKR